MNIDLVLNELVVANRILAHENIMDGYGHVSVRHPGNPHRFFMSRLRAPSLVERADVMEFDLSGNPVADDRRSYRERFIHCAIYEARPDVAAVVHAHTEDVLPFSITGIPMQAVIHSSSVVGSGLPVWDIADAFGDTNLLVTAMPQGRDLARCLGSHAVVLMRGHGFAAAARSLIEVVRMAIYLPRNARTQMAAIRLGAYTPLSAGEIDARNRDVAPYSPEAWRAWQHWAHRAGCAHLLPEEPGPGHTAPD